MPSIFSFYNSDENSRPKHRFLDTDDHPEAGNVDSFFVNIARCAIERDHGILPRTILHNMSEEVIAVDGIKLEGIFCVCDKRTP